MLFNRVPTETCPHFLLGIGFGRSGYELLELTKINVSKFRILRNFVEKSTRLIRKIHKIKVETGKVSRQKTYFVESLVAR